MTLSQSHFPAKHNALAENLPHLATNFHGKLVGHGGFASILERASKPWLPASRSQLSQTTAKINLYTTFQCFPVCFGLVDILWKFRKVGKGWRLPAYVHLAQVSLACCSLHTPAIHQKLQLRSWIQIQKISPRNQRYYIGINRHIRTLDTSLNGRNVKTGCPWLPVTCLDQFVNLPLHRKTNTSVATSQI